MRLQEGVIESDGYVGIQTQPDNPRDLELFALLTQPGSLISSPPSADVTIPEPCRLAWTSLGKVEY